jgi:hypothetical protein
VYMCVRACVHGHLMEGRSEAPRVCVCVCVCVCACVCVRGISIGTLWRGVARHHVCVCVFVCVCVRVCVVYI